MKRLICKSLTTAFLWVAFVSCKRGERQIITLRNSSLENIYFLVSGNSILSDPNEIGDIRPIIVQDTEVANSIKGYSHRHQIAKDSLKIIINSESAEIFTDIVSIQSIIKDRYNGQLNIFIINENKVLTYSDQDIIDKKLYKHFKTITAEQMNADTLALEYR